MTLQNLPTRVKLVDVGPRDGLQNEKQMVPAAIKIGLIDRLQQAGVRHLEATSFVSPKWVPQMGDAVEVMAGLPRRADVVYSVLTPNMKGFEGALAAGANEVVVFGAASQAFSQKNINCSIEESIERFAPVVVAAHANGISVRGAISCAMGCPYEGDVAPERVELVARLMKAIGVDHVGVADTIGVGTPRKVQAAMAAALRHYDVADISGHFHDTYGQALANTLAALEMGVAQYDTSIAGLGGCPYAKGATGNVATEDVVYMLHGMGIDTGLDLDKLVDASQYISDHLGPQTQFPCVGGVAQQADGCLSARPPRQVARPVANQGQRQAAQGETPGRSPVSSSTSEGLTRRGKSGGALKVDSVADGRISLAQQLVQVTKCVQAVQAGRSLADALPAVPGPLRPGVQALTFHALRRLGTTMALVSLLVERPPAAATRALLGASLALLLPGEGDASVDHAKANLQPPTPGPDGLPAASSSVVDAATHSGPSSLPRYDAFTVVDQAVNAAHSVRNLASQAGLINACLRRFLRESDALLAQVSTDWEAHWNHPAWWVKRVRRDHPQHWQAVLWASNQPAPLTLRVNTTQVSRSDYMQHLQAAGWSAALGEMGDAAITLLRTPQARTGAVDTLPGFAEGWFSVQDAAAQVAAPLLLNGLLAQRQGSAASDQSAPPLQGHRLRVLDACAAPGGKTAHLLESAQQQGISLSLQALEVDAQRSLRITENLQRLRLPAQPSGAGEQASEVGVVVANAADVSGWWDGQLFDAILLDAPCTASGIGRRHPDVRWLRRDTDVAALVATQRTLLDALWPLLAPGGRMVYCTCSVFKAEGQGQIDAFLSRHTDVSAGPSPGHLLPAPPAQGVDMADNAAREHDGFFYARLDKTAL